MATKKLEAVISLNDKFSSKAKGVERSSSRMESGLKSIGTTALATASILGTAAVAGMALLGKTAISSAAKFETMGVALKTSFQGNQAAADAAQKQITDFAAKTPFQLDEVMNGFIKLKNMGLDPSQEAMTSYGDTASAMGKSLNDMVEAVADAATGEFERLKEFGIRASSEGDRVKFTFQGVTTEVGKNSEEIENYLKELGETKFAGGMAAQAETLSGKMSTLKDNFSLALTQIVNDSGLFDIVKNNVSGLSSMIGDMTPKIIGAMKGFQDWFKNKEYNEWFAGIQVWLEEHGIKMEDLKAIIATFVDIYEHEVKPALAAFGALLADIVGPEIENTKKEFEKLFEQIKPHIPLIIKLTAAFIGIAALFVGATAAGLIVVIALFVKFSLKIVQLISMAQRFSIEWWNIFSDFILGIANIDAKFKDFIGGIINSLAAFVVAGDTKFNEFSQGAIDAIASIPRGIIDSFRRMVDVIRGAMNQAVSTVRTKVSQIKSSISSATGGLINIGGSQLNTGGYVNSFGAVKKFAAGGVVGGSGVRDTVPALLSPGEMVINPRRGQKMGTQLTLNITGNTFGSRGDVDYLVDQIKNTLSREIELSNLGAF